MELISVSLLPPEFKQVSVAHQRQRSMFVGFAIICSLLLVVVITLAITVRITRGELESILTYQQVLEQQVQALAPYEKAFEELTKLNSIIEEVTDGQVEWTELMLELGRYLPQGVWLTDLRGTVESGTSQGEIILRGGAKDHIWVSRFLEELRSLPMFSDVRCLFSVGDSPDLTQFEITGSIVPLTAVTSKEVGQ